MQGGNIAFEFDQPVYAMVRTVKKSSVHTGEDIVSEVWSPVSSSNHLFSILVTPPGRKNSLCRIIFQHEMVDQGMWTGSKYDVSFEDDSENLPKPSVAYSSNGNPPRLNRDFPVFSFGNNDRRYFRYYLRFSKTKPKQDEAGKKPGETETRLIANGKQE